MGAVLERQGIAAALLLTAVSATAHHSRTIYDSERSVTINGVVEELEWANPHVYLFVREENATGGAVLWEIEQGSTTAMRRLGWSRDTLSPGDRVVVRANPGRDPSKHIALVATVEKDGVTYYGRGSLAPDRVTEDHPAVGAEGLTGTWVVEQGPMVGHFSEPADWPVTQRGAAARDSYDDRTMNPQIQCTARSAPWFMIFPSVQRIEVGEESVSIRSEYDTVERIVHLDSASHDGATVAHQGHSIGWWDGDVLVVDTTHFADHRSGNARGIPSGARKHLVERFELSPDRTRLIYRFELQDPEYLSRPVTGEVRSTFRPDLEFSPVACDPENASRFVGE